MWSSLTALGSGVTENAGEGIEKIYNGESTFCRLVGGLVGTGFTLSPVGLTASTVVMKVSMGAETTATIRVNGIDYETAAAAFDGEITADLDSPTAITTIELVRASGDNNYGAYYIKTDGRLLVDQGVWNNSQNWSDGIDPNGLTYNEPNANRGDWASIFNGDLVLGPNVKEANTPFSITFDPPLSGLVEFYNTDSPSLVKWSLDNSTYNNTNSGWTSVGSSVSTIYFKLQGNTNVKVLNAMRLNGAILTDSGVQWDTSQVWSSGGSDSDLDNGSWKHAFNGETGSHDTTAEWSAYAYGSDAAYTFPIPVSGKLGFLMSGGASADSLGKITLSDGQNLEVVNGASTAEWVYANVTDLTGFTLIANNVLNGTALNQVSLNGEMLVDAGSFGTNGFYLPFDPAATGVKYSSHLTKTSEADHTLAGAPEKAFDENDSTWFEIYVLSSSAPASAAFNTTINNVTTLEIYGGPSATGAGTLRVSGTNITTTDLTNMAGPSTSSNSVTVTTPGQPVSDLVFEVTGSGASLYNNMRIQKIVVNGKPLVDYSSIGIDDSGNDNHFRDTNFINSSNNFYINKDFVNVETTQGAIDGSPTQLFDGRLDTGVGAGQTARTNTFTLGKAVPIEAGQLVEAYVSSGKSGQYYVIVDSSGNTISTATVGPLNPQWIPFNSSSSNDIKEVRQVDTNGNYGGLAISAIRVNGKILTFNSIDTVVDTPLKNYAVLSSGNNGSLVTDSTPSGGHYGLVSKDDLYYEYVPRTVTSGGNSWASVGTSAPASESNFTGVKFDDLSIWSINGWVPSGATGSISAGDVVGIAWKNTTLSVFVNGEHKFSAYRPLITGDVSFKIRNDGINTGNVNAGQQPFAASNVTHDLAAGTVEIASTIPDTSQVWSDEWVGSSTIFSQTSSFDGNLTTFTSNSTSLNNCTWTSPTDLTGPFRIYAAGINGGGNTLIKINGDYITLLDTTPRWYDLDVDTLDTIQLFDIGATAGKLYAVEANGNILVDNDPTQDQSQVWSETIITSTVPPESDGPFKLAFDGNPLTYVRAGGDGDNITVNLTGFTGEPSVVINNNTFTPMTAVFNFADGTNVEKAGESGNKRWYWMEQSICWKKRSFK